MKPVSMEALKYFYSKLEQIFSGVTVTIEPQTFTEEQKAQARANIGVDSSDVSVDGTSIVKSNENVISLATDLQDKINSAVTDVDSALSDTSENPVQNKVITAVIGDINSVLEAIV